MLAYSTIAQMGFMLLGLTPVVIGGSTVLAANGYSSAMFYLVSYVLTTLGTFGLVMILSRRGFESEEVSDLAGLGQRSPWMGAAMTIFMLSLAGVPPFVGFYAKLSVLQALVTTGSALHIGVAVLAVVLSLVGAYYYLRVIKVMWFDAPVHAHSLTSDDHLLPQGLLALNGALVFLFGIWPSGLMAVCRDAVVRALAS